MWGRKWLNAKGSQQIIKNVVLSWSGLMSLYFFTILHLFRYWSIMTQVKDNKLSDTHIYTAWNPKHSSINNIPVFELPTLSQRKMTAAWICSVSELSINQPHTEPTSGRLGINNTTEQIKNQFAIFNRPNLKAVIHFRGIMNGLLGKWNETVREGQVRASFIQSDWLYVVR